VLEASDLEDLKNRIDVLTVDERLWGEYKHIKANKRATEEAPTSARGSKLDMSSLNTVLGQAAAERCQRGYEAQREVSRLVSQIVPKFKEIIADLRAQTTTETSKPEEEEEVSTRAEEEGGDFSDLLYDSRIPLPARRELAGLYRTIAAACVIGRAEELGKRLEPWLAMGLADLFADSPLRLKGLWDSLPQTGPEFIAKGAQLLAKLGEDEAERREMSAVADEWRRQAATSGEGIYFPLGGDDGEAR
jgi:hypothetical protein